MDIVIHEIEEKDYSMVTTLLVNDLWDNNFNGDYVTLFFNKVKDDENYRTFVALAKNDVIGIISTVTFNGMIAEYSSTLFIQCFVVKYEYRGRGIGKKLINHVEEYARAKGICGIGLQSGVKRTAAHGFYEHNGYTRSNYFYKNF